MKFWAVANDSRMDWVSILSLLVIGLALASALRIFTVGDRVPAPRENPVSVRDESRGIAAHGQQPPAGNPVLEKPHYAISMPLESPVPQTMKKIAVDLLGINVQLREVRMNSGGSEPGELRNIEFFIREGIRPLQLFEDSTQLVTGYWPLLHNNVGYGATTVRILYQLVETDSDGDGVLSRSDRKSLAFSLPDGSHYRVLDRDVGDISRMTYLSESGELQLEFLQGGKIRQRMYLLAVGSN